MTLPTPSPLGARAPLAGRRFGYLSNVILLGAVASTNDFGKAIAEELLEDGTELPPTAFVTRRQTAGRGRGSRSWVTPDETGLAISLVLPWPEGPERVRLPLRLGVIVARGIARRFGVEARLKWPNDLLVGRRKLGGILVEARAGAEGEGYAVAGIGLNVSTARSTLDAAGLPEATSLSEEGAAPAALAGDAPVVALLEELDAGLSAPAFDLAPAFESVSAHRAGERLTVVEGGRQTTGTYLGVTADGFLRLGSSGSEETVVSGDIASF